MRLHEQPLAGSWVYPEVERTHGRHRVVLAIVRGPGDELEPLPGDAVDARLIDATGQALELLGRPGEAALTEVGGPSATATAVFDFGESQAPPEELVVTLSGQRGKWPVREEGPAPRPFRT